MKRVTKCSALILFLILAGLPTRGFSKNPTSDLTFDETVNFGPINCGSEDCKSILIMNAGGDDCTIDSIRIENDANQVFHLGPWSPVTIHPNSRGTTIDVCYKLLNALTTNDHATLVFHFAQKKNGLDVTGDASISLLGNADTRGKDSCLVAQVPIIGPVLVGGAVTDSIALDNPTTHAMKVMSASFDPGDSNFSVVSTLPITIAALGTAQLYVKFTPHEYSQVDPSRGQTFGVKGSLLIQLSGDSLACDKLSVDVGGLGLEPMNDTTVTALFPNSTTVVGIVARPHSGVTKVKFYNNLNTSVKVLSASLRDGVDFNITGTSPILPAVLQPGDHLVVSIELLSNLLGFYQDELTIVTDHNAVSQTYGLQGVLTAQSSYVSPSTGTSTSIEVAPNPSSGSVRVALRDARSAEMLVFDLLGNAIASHMGTEPWIWDASVNGSRVPSGMYFLRISGVSRDGNPFVTSRHLVIGR